MEIALTCPRSLQDPDVALVRRMADGDEDALRSLYGKCGQRLFAYAYRVTGNRSVAEEVLQDSLLAAWQGARRFRGESRVLTWLLGIVHHQALNAVRRKQLPIAELEEVVEAIDNSSRPDDRAEAVDRRRALSAALGQLSAEHRAVLALVFYHGLGLSEVAQVCQCPLGTVKSRLSYAKTHLREAFQRAGLQVEDLL